MSETLEPKPEMRYFVQNAHRALERVTTISANMLQEFDTYYEQWDENPSQEPIKGFYKAKPYISNLWSAHSAFEERSAAVRRLLVHPYTAKDLQRHAREGITPVIETVPTIATVAEELFETMLLVFPDWPEKETGVNNLFCVYDGKNSPTQLTHPEVDERIATYEQALRNFTSTLKRSA